MKRIDSGMVMGLVLGCALLAGCAGSAQEPAQESPTTEFEQESQRPESDEREPEVSTSQTPTEPVKSASDLLLPDDVIEAYSPSFPIEQAYGGVEDQSEFPELENVRPAECTALLNFLTSPVPSTSGSLVSFASNYVSREFPGGAQSQRIFVFKSEQDAKDAFEAATDIAAECRSARGRWAQQGPIKIDDGYIDENLNVGEIRELGPNAVVYEEKLDFEGLMPGAFGLALADNAVIFSDFYTFDESSNDRRRQLFDAFVLDGLEYAKSGTRPEREASDDLAGLTLDCLELEALPYSLLENYSEYAGEGAGTDLFVESRQAATNECGKEISGYRYAVEFLDEFGDVFFRGTGTVSVAIPPGEMRESPSNEGFLIRSVIAADEIKTFTETPQEDVTVEFTATQILFEDESSLP